MSNQLPSKTTEEAKVTPVEIHEKYFSFSYMDKLASTHDTNRGMP